MSQQYYELNYELKDPNGRIAYIHNESEDDRQSIKYWLKEAFFGFIIIFLENNHFYSYTDGLINFKLCFFFFGFIIIDNWKKML